MFDSYYGLWPGALHDLDCSMFSMHSANLECMYYMYTCLFFIYCDAPNVCITTAFFLLIKKLDKQIDIIHTVLII